MFSAYAHWRRSAFGFTGEVHTFEGRSFCPDCGGRLFCLHPGDVEIRIGSLDDAPTGLNPRREGWIKRREHWLASVAGAHQYTEDVRAEAQLGGG